ncbi:MAG TPA: lysophospholipid acyltransferase family protein [Sedimentisphaerales bacterium]|nr:lysophospholipid acyltransferase family protein [Sedimentisphaerales bacterium]HQG48894.1 lysophospholipid acyltransferase family protein [Sedimentisphaerales bacterium]HQI28278.1 lysophospholipid acyltransferase family protein [Sedimentisphaerales bacterium]
MHKVLTIVFAFFFSLLLRCVCGSNRLTVTRRDIFDEYVEQGNNIFVFWHSRLFYLVYYYMLRAPRCKVCMLVSMSRDGDYGAALVRRLKQEVVRGSSSRGGQAAVRNLVSRIASGSNVAITPDGPRGPALTVSEGVVKLAQMTGARIIPVSYSASRRFLLKSWDRFIVVKPFGRVHVAFGEPIRVPRRISSEQRRHFVQQVERALLALDQTCTEKLADRAVERMAEPSVSLSCDPRETSPSNEVRVG